MTIFEHAMLGGTLALALGSHRRQGWGLVAAAALAGTWPDWDGLSLAFGAEAYARVHRVWGHNLLVAGSTGLILGGLAYLCRLSGRTRRATISLLGDKAISREPSSVVFSFQALFEWLVVCLAASLVHLPADVVYSGHPQMQNWPLRLLWPFSEEGWVLPWVPWGSVTTSLIFVVEMFALYRWPRLATLLAWLTLLVLHVYIGFCGFLGGIEQR